MKPKFLSLVFLIPTSAAFAADQSWDGGAAGTGTAWLTLANWAGDTAYAGAIGSTTNTDIASFDLGTNSTAQVNFTTAGGNFSLGAIEFNRGTAMTLGASSVSGLYRLNGATVSGVANTIVRTESANNLNLGGTGAANSSFTLGTANGVIYVNNAGGSVTFQQSLGEITPGSGITKDGAGTLDIQAAGTYTGGAMLKAGLTSFRVNNAFGSGTITLDGTGVELRNNNTAASLSNNITIGSTGDLKTLGSTITGTVFSGGITINEETSGNFVVNPQTTNAMTISGNITGSGGAGLKKTGTSSILVLSGNNSYTGDTLIAGGTLRAGSTTMLPNGTGKGNVSISSSATLDLNGYNNIINGLSGITGNIENDATSTAVTLTMGAGDVDGLTFSGSIRDNNGTGGTLALLKTGTGAQTLGAANSYSGGTTIQAGRINAGASGALGSGNVLLDGTGAQLRLSANGVVISNALTITNTGNSKTLSAFNTGGATTYSGGITINETTGGNFSVQVGDAHTLTISGNISGTGGAGLTKTSAGALTLSGTNSYTGPNLINQGVVSANTSNALGAATNVITIGNTNTAAGTTSTLNVGASLTTGTLSSAAMATPSSGTNGIQINLQSGNTLTVNQTADATFAGDLIGAGQLTLGSSSTSKLILTGSSTYTGSTTLNAGTLLVNGSLGDTVVTVNTGATLSGSGTIGTGAVLNTVTVNGTLGPGNSPGLLTINDNLAFGSGGVLMMQLEGTIAGTGYDQVILNGAGSLAGTLSLAWNLLSTASDGTILTLISNDGSDAFTGSFNYAEGATVTDNLGGSWTLSYLGNGGNDLILTAVPEPAAALLGGLGMLMLLRRRR